jgi:hypothetical protein
VAVPEGQLPVAVGRVIDGVEVELGTESSPASLESWPGDGSMTSDMPKISRHWGQAGDMLIG